MFSFRFPFSVTYPQLMIAFSWLSVPLIIYPLVFPPKSYERGVKDGYEKAQKDFALLLLTATTTTPPPKKEKENID